MPPSTSRSDSLALVAICLATLMFGLEISSVPVILPTLENVLHAGFRDLQWIMNAYTIACTTVLMATGTLADRFGRKRVFLLCIAAFGLTSLLCGLATDVAVLIAGRFLQGMAGGAMFICTVAVLSHQFREGAERSRAFVAWGVISGIGLGFGPLAGGLIVAVSSWPWVFLIQLPLAALSLLLAFVHVRESRDPNATRLDLAGIVTLSVAVFALTFAITQGPELGGFASPATLAILAAALAAFVAFVRVERRHAHPMFDFSVFRIRAFSGAIVGCAGMNFSYWPFMIYLPIYFHAVLGYDSTTSGLFLLAYTLPFLAMTPVAEHLLQRCGARIAVPLGLATIGAGFLLMAWGAAADAASGWTMLPGTLLAGIGIGLTNTPVTNTTTAAVSSDRAGMASGIDVSARLIALAVNIAVMGLLLQEGVRTRLAAAGGAIEPAALRAAAENVAAGHFATADAGARAALAHGFSWVLLYGGLGVLALAALSYALFGASARTAPARPPALAAEAADGPNPASCNG